MHKYGVDLDDGEASGRGTRKMTRKQVYDLMGPSAESDIGGRVFTWRDQNRRKVSGLIKYVPFCLLINSALCRTASIFSVSVGFFDVCLLGTHHRLFSCGTNSYSTLSFGITTSVLTRFVQWPPKSFEVRQSVLVLITEMDSVRFLCRARLFVLLRLVESGRHPLRVSLWLPSLCQLFGTYSSYLSISPQLRTTVPSSDIKHVK